MLLSVQEAKLATHKLFYGDRSLPRPTTLARPGAAKPKVPGYFSVSFRDFDPVLAQNRWSTHEAQDMHKQEATHVQFEFRRTSLLALMVHLDHSSLDLQETFDSSNLLPAKRQREGEGEREPQGVASKRQLWVIILLASSLSATCVVACESTGLSPKA